VSAVRLIIRALFAAAALAGLTSRAQELRPAAASPTPTEDPTDSTRVVWRFDFDERPLGNYEDTPMYWQRLAGPGLPPYNRGVFDDRLGHAAPPSFRLNVQAGSLAYEFGSQAIGILPRADYLVVGYIRPDRLRHARAFLAAEFVDRFGRAIDGSRRVSALVRASSDEPQPWQRVEIVLPGDFLSAHALHLQMWVLQEYAWRQPGPHEIDPIIRQDVNAGAWFDDVAVYCLPRAALRPARPGGLVPEGQPATLLIELHNTAPTPLQAELEVTDADGARRHAVGLELPADADPAASEETTFTLRSPPEPAPALAAGARRSPVEVRLPLLPTGLYTARLRLSHGPQPLLERSLALVVLPELPAAADLRQDVAVDLGPWRGGDGEALRALLGALRCGAIKLGVPATDAAGDGRESATLTQLAGLLRELAQQRIETTAVLAGPEPVSLHDLVESARGWEPALDRPLEHLAGLVPTWQLGDESREVGEGAGWRPPAIEQVRRHMNRFITSPLLIVPQHVANPAATDGDVASLWIPAHVPTRDLPHALDFLAEPRGGARCWLELESLRGLGLSRERRLAELARRFVLAKSLRPERICLAAPFAFGEQGGRPQLEANDEFLALRTLFHFLSSKDAVAAFQPVPDATGVIFDAGGAGCLVIWTWREQALSAPVALYVGPDARAFDLEGRPVSAPVSRGRMTLRVTPQPIIVAGVHTPSALLQSSYSLAPTQVQVHSPEPRPVLSFRNPYPVPLTGLLRLESSDLDLGHPATLPVSLAPDETFAQPLQLALPPRRLAQAHDLTVRIEVQSPEPLALEFTQRLEAGLHDIQVEAAARWRGSELIVEQTLWNLSASPLSFAAFCEPPGAPRAERFALDLPPGESAVLSYVFPDSRRLAGSRLLLGVHETRGPRELQLLVDIPAP